MVFKSSVLKIHNLSFEIVEQWYIGNDYND